MINTTVDTTNKTIEKIFFEQVKKMTLNREDSFDLQFSDALL